MLKIAICEDERYMLSELNMKVKKYLEKTKTAASVTCFESGISLLCVNDCFDVIVMDIKMVGIDGMEVIRRLREKGINSQVIFVTSSRDYVFQAFDLDAVHYLMKPVSDENLFCALDKAIRRTAWEDKQVITITKGSDTRVVPFRDICYMESIGHKIYIYTKTEKIDCHIKLDALEHMADDRFFRCHRSYIVNMNFVSKKEEGTIIMINGDRILVSRRKEQLFKQRLLSYLHHEVL